MFITDTVVIGAGHAGLAVSHELSRAGRDHVVLDRGRVAERWRSERWDSLHLLTPNWMTRLPGWSYSGADREGFMPVRGFITYLEEYAGSFRAPVVPGTTVLSVTARSTGYRVVTDQGAWSSRNVVVATGPWGRPVVPPGTDPAGLHVTTAGRYRNPAALPDGGVLVVGASSSGVQIADELARAGRRVVLAVGRHTRMPRRYRGMDVFWWLERTGRLARTIDEVRDPKAARSEPSMQLVGRNNAALLGESVDLAALAAREVRVTGRLAGINAGVAAFEDNLVASVAESDLRMHRFLDSVDEHIEHSGLAGEVWEPDRPRPFVPAAVPSRLHLPAEGIGTVVLATGYRPHHPWLHVPVIAPDGSIRQQRGVTAAPGLFVVGQRFQHRRDSGFIDGARHDVTHVVERLCSDKTLDTTAR